MSHDVLCLFAPIFTHARFNDPAWTRPGRVMYQSNALRFLPSKASVPLLIDHREDREIGRVNSLFVMKWVDGPWWAADCTVSGTPPIWLKRHTPVSFQFKVIHRRDVNVHGVRADVVADAFVNEITVVSPDCTPLEPLAQVVLFKRAERTVPGTNYVLQPGDVELPPSGRPIRRYFENAVIRVY